MIDPPIETALRNRKATVQMAFLISVWAAHVPEIQEYEPAF